VIAGVQKPAQLPTSVRPANYVWLVNDGISDSGILISDGHVRLGVHMREGDMPKGYFLSEVDVANPEAFEAYRTRVLPTVEKFGGCFLVRSGQPKATQKMPNSEAR
jgi:hypothetical protein